MELSEYKRGVQATWGTGDYDRMARTEGLYVTGAVLVRRAGVEAGDEVLDVACGTGNATIPAAATGAKVTGLDLSPEMLAAAAARAVEAGHDMAWREGDAEALPFNDGSFDVVLSSFGAMFAPRHVVVAGELARVLRPGGRLAMSNWAPDGAIGEFFSTVKEFAPPMPDFAEPPLLWGDESHVRRLFEGTRMELEFDRDRVTLRAASVAEAVELYSTDLGPLAQTRLAAEAEGRWPMLRDRLTTFFERHNAATDGTVAWSAEYIVVLGRKQT
jgi:SAM-dependent methyltransferase